jgi:hypothetical protein
MLTDILVYWIAIRGLRVIFSEYEYRQTVAPISKGKEISTKSTRKWKIMISIVLFMTFLETLFSMAARLSSSLSDRDTHIFLMVLGALIYSPMNKLAQFSGFFILVLK